MAISSIADLLSGVAWEHAYCTEGSAFGSSAVFGTVGGGGWRTGSLAWGGRSVLTLWPDEIGADDLTTTSAATAPNYVASDSALGSRPSVDFDTNFAIGDFLRVDWTDIPQPFEVIVIGRYGSNDGTTRAVVACGLTTGSTPGNLNEVQAVLGGGNTRWAIHQGFASVTSASGTFDTNPHVFNWRPHSTTAQLYEEATGVITSGGSGTNVGSTLTLGNRWNLSTGGRMVYCFVGVKASALTAGERSDIISFSASHYGTP